MLVTSGEAQREARGEAAAAGQMPVLLVAGEAFAEAFADAGVGCRIVSIPEADEEFLATAAEAAAARGDGPQGAPRGAGPPGWARGARRGRDPERGRSRAWQARGP